LTQLSGLASQKCWWASTTKYLSPFFSYMPLLSTVGRRESPLYCSGTAARQGLFG
jgi:hypothetical protein